MRSLMPEGVVYDLQRRLIAEDYGVSHEAIRRIVNRKHARRSASQGARRTRILDVWYSSCV
jgi:hypothetical protein